MHDSVHEDDIVRPKPLPRTGSHIRPDQFGRYSYAIAALMEVSDKTYGRIPEANTD